MQKELLLKGEEMENELDLLAIILQSSFFVQFILLLLIAASILSWAIVYKKIQHFKLVHTSNDAFYESFKKSAGLSELYRESLQHNEGPLALMYRRGFEELQKISEKIGKSGSGMSLGEYFSRSGFQSLERALKTGVNDSQTKAEQMQTTLASIGSISPFVGLFGTVIGIINSFSGLAGGGGSIEAVAPGIAEALVATAVGLGAAIPAVWFFNRFNKDIESLNSSMESFGQEFLNLIERSILIGQQNPGAGVDKFEESSHGL